VSKRYGRLIASLVEGLTAPQHPWRRADTQLRIADALVQRHEVATRHGRLVFVTTHPEALQFPRELLDREPETIEWIDSFEAPCRFWDIGANIGTYALYAGLRPGIDVLAFEPAPASYAALCRNIEANGQGDRITGCCVALSDRTRLGSLNMSATNAGNSFNSFESTKVCFGRELDIRFRLSAIGFAIDDFRRLFAIAPPHYLKIDVDGVEQQILDGAAETLADPELRSVLIELEDADTDRNAGIVERLERAGFTLAIRGANHAGSANAIFIRKDPLLQAPPFPPPQTGEG
jgi:FkbM family methyltransferase